MPHRFGPTLLAPPLSNVWQVWQTLAAASPRLGSALASSCPSGSCGADGAAPPPPGFSGTAISYPGLAGSGGEKIAPAAMFNPRRHRHVNRIAPRILLSSNESIAQRLRKFFRLAGP